MIKLDQKAIDSALRRISLGIIKQIQDNTKHGVDMNGVDFTKYSEGYKTAKAKYQIVARVVKKRGYTRYTGTVDLKRSGVMLRSIRSTKVGDHYEIYIANADRAVIGYYHHMGIGDMPKREFFGISQQNETELFNRYFNTPILVKA